MSTEIDFDIKEVWQEPEPPNLRQRLEQPVLDKITEVLEANDCLVELGWQPKGGVYRTQESVSVVSETCLLTVRAILDEGVSAHIHDNGQVTALAEELRQELVKVLPSDLRVDVERPVWDDDRWVFMFRALPTAEVIAETLTESLDDDDGMKELSEPEDKNQRIKQMFQGHGLHVASISEEPQAEEWGDLGNPQRIVVTWVQPTYSLPWTASGHSNAEMPEYLARIREDLASILGIEQENAIDWTSRWRMEPGCWEITWFIGDPDIGEKRVIEGLEDDDDFKDLVKPIDVWQVVENAKRVLKELGITNAKVFTVPQHHPDHWVQHFTAVAIPRGPGQLPFSTEAVTKAFEEIPGVIKVTSAQSGMKREFSLYTQEFAPMFEAMEDDVAYPPTVAELVEELKAIGFEPGGPNVFTRLLDPADHRKGYCRVEFNETFHDAQVEIAQESRLGGNLMSSLKYVKTNELLAFIHEHAAQPQQEAMEDDVAYPPEPRVFRNDFEVLMAEAGITGILCQLIGDEDQPNILHGYLLFSGNWAPGRESEWVRANGIALMRSVNELTGCEPRNIYFHYESNTGKVEVGVPRSYFGESQGVSAVVAALTEDEPSAAEIQKEAAKADDAPTEEQKEAGNYAKGHIELYGLDITIENAKGSTRSGKNKAGKEWSVTMPAHYGYICGTEGKDKDHIDVYIGPDPDSDKVYVVNQKREEGGFDEHKVMLGFTNKFRAVRCYDRAFNDGLGPKLRESVIVATVDQFKEWLERGNHKQAFAKLTESFVAWHSSPYSFRKFDTSREGAHFGTREQADNLRKAGKKASKPYLIDIKNPLRMRDIGVWTIDGIASNLHRDDIISDAEADAIYEERNWSDERGYEKIKELLMAKGYDGIVYENEEEGPGDSYIAFYSRQIKPYRPVTEGEMEEPDDLKDVSGYTVVEEHVIQELTQAGLRDIKPGNFGGSYRRYDGQWLPNRNPDIVVDHFSKAMANLGVHAHAVGLSYDAATGETSVMLRRGVYDIQPPQGGPESFTI